MASRKARIEDEVAELSPASFQSLAQELISQYLGYDRPTHRGSATNSSATAPGTPDTYWVLPEGQFAYLECGHYPERNKALRKIEEDIEKCLATEKAELEPGQLAKIVIAYSCRRFKSAEIARIRAIDSRIELIGVDQMARLLAHDYPSFAKEHLGISVNSGQIMELSEFEDKSERGCFSASLKVTLLGREHELDDLSLAIHQQQVVLLYGKPGMGKTRLALEATKLFAEKNQAKALAISSNGLPIWDDLSTDIPPNSKCIILVDDANELSALSGFADFISKRL